jgi:hypothetical protein
MEMVETTFNERRLGAIGRREWREENVVRFWVRIEQEDYKLAYFVGLFGDRRWDFIAKVSGLEGGGRE